MIDVRKIQLNESVVVNERIDIAMPGGWEPPLHATVAVFVVGRLVNTGRAFMLDAQAACRPVAACSRCLDDVAQDISFHIKEDFVEAELATDEEIGFSDKTIDIFPAVQRNLFLNIPMKPLCAADCAGLCPRCGKNLNEGGCDCKGEINEQFRQLLQYFDD